MPVAQPPTAPLHEYHFLSVFRHFGHHFARLGILGHCPQRHVQDNILSVASVHLGPAAVFTVLGHLVALVFKVNQGPVLAVAAQDHVAAPSAVSAVGAAELDEFLAAEVARSRAPVAGAGVYLDVVYEVGGCHGKSC